MPDVNMVNSMNLVRGVVKIKTRATEEKTTSVSKSSVFCLTFVITGRETH